MLWLVISHLHHPALWPSSSQPQTADGPVKMASKGPTFGAVRYMISVPHSRPSVLTACSLAAPLRLLQPVARHGVEHAGLVVGTEY